MINEEQKNLMLRFIGAGSVFFKAYEVCPGLNNGSRIYYLEQAIKQDGPTFLKTLDKLHTELKADPKSAQIILNGLKCINDFYFNNPIEGSDQKSLDKCFGPLGLVIPDEFKKLIANVISSNCAVFAYGSKEEVLQKHKKDRELSDADRPTDNSWRNPISCPPAPLMMATLSHDGHSFFRPKTNYSYGETLDRYKEVPSSTLPSPEAKVEGRRQYSRAQLITALRAMENTLVKPAEGELSQNGFGCN